MVVFTAIFLMIVIETQRSYSKLSPRFRKQSVRVAIFLGSWGVAILGAALFSQAGLASSMIVASAEIVPMLNSTSAPFVKMAMLAIFLVALPVALIRSFRQLRFEELIYHLPRNGLKELLVLKRHKATSFAQFAHFELFVLLICLLYASSVAEIAKVFLSLFTS